MCGKVIEARFRLSRHPFNTYLKKNQEPSLLIIRPLNWTFKVKLMKKVNVILKVIYVKYIVHVILVVIWVQFWRIIWIYKKKFCQPTRRSQWTVNPFSEKNPWWLYLAAGIPALLSTILIFLDQQITAVIVNRKENKLKVK